MIDHSKAGNLMIATAVMIRDEFPGHDIGAFLFAAGWVEQLGGVDEYGQGEFRSFRHNELNVLLVWDVPTYAGWMASVEVCKFVGVTTREQRVAIHRIIMDGELACNLPSCGSVGNI